MKRSLSLVLAVAFVALVLLLPEVAPARLAALECHKLLGEGEPTLAELVLDGPATRELEEGVLELTLHGVRLAAPADAGNDLVLNGVARRSLVRGLREAAQGRGATLEVVGEVTPSTDTAGGANFLVELGEDDLTLTCDTGDDLAFVPTRASVPWSPPSRWSVLPPLIAIALAVVLRKPLPSLFCGVVAGAFLLRLRAGSAVLSGLPLSVRDVATDLFWPELVDPSRYMIVLFVVFMLAMVGVITCNGGVRGVMDRIAGIANSAARTQLATYLMGLAVFFDDYANTILVGSTMRPLSDRWKISREKLAYLIDSTAAPVAGLAVLSTWIAFEVSTFSAQLPAAGLSPDDGYSVFLQTLPYRFYCILTLLFVGLVAFTGRDFGPMRRAEERARRTGQLVRPGGQPLVAEDGLSLEPVAGIRPRAWTALLPVFAFVAVTLFEIARAGGAFAMGAGELFTIEGLTGVLYDGSGSQPLMVGSGVGLLLAAVVSLGLGMGAPDILKAAWRVLSSMGIAILILYHAWMIGAVCGELGTASYLTALIGESLDARLLPALLFLLSGLVAFATGSSWSTMSILLPLVVGLAYALGADAALADTPAASGQLLMIMSIGAVLEGAIFGDHCSPISDTTVMSSIAAASDHIDHVRTQVPYAVTTMGAAMLLGYLPCTYFGVSPYLALVFGAVALVVVLLWMGRRPEPGTAQV
ncbi:MAG: Na+/H+ antiporter NhaC family protein [Planctomycetota bacterium]